MHALIIDDCLVARSCLRETLRETSIHCEEAGALAAAADEYLMKPFDSRASKEKRAMLGIGEAQP